ncbi:hypothetical protein GCM10010329_36940 [Streptomyces spiroverticillatus]|nr:hypothetical protein GCM10010329_36940 [Streptomyces spiroverticillatus]
MPFQSYSVQPRPQPSELTVHLSGTSVSQRCMAATVSGERRRVPSSATPFARWRRARRTTSEALAMTRPYGPAERGIMSQAGAGSGICPGSPRCPMAARKARASSGRVMVCVAPSGARRRVFRASSQVWPVRTSTMRPSTL